MLLLLAACADAPEPADSADPASADTFAAPDAPGPHRAGVATLTFVDARGVALTAEVWYPAGEGGEDPEPYPELPFPSEAWRDAPPVPGPWPLVAFSHGNGGLRTQSPFFTERLATHGFVVVAPDHPHNTALDFDETRLPEVAAARPGDVVSAVDEVFARSAGGDPLLGGLVEPDRYGMSGHSFGGWTTVAVAGGVVDFAAMEAFCAENDGYDLCGLDAPADLEVPDAPDPRAVAAMPMAPAGWYAFGETGLDGVAPTLLLGGSRDEGETIEGEIQPLYDRLPAPRRLGIVQGAGHYAFSDACAVWPVFPECAEEADGYVDLDAAHAVIAALGVAFFQVQLNADARYEAWLAARWPELLWDEDLGAR